MKYPTRLQLKIIAATLIAMAIYETAKWGTVQRFYESIRQITSREVKP